MNLKNLALACALLSFGAAAQTYPSRPIRTILTYAGGAEPIARLIAQKMSESLGQPVLIDAQTGANGSVGALAAARASPDGYTILSSTGATQIIRGFLVKNVPYDPFRDFVPLAHTFDAVGVVVAHPSAPATFRELLEYAKRNPGALSYGTTGIGSAYHMAAELVHQLTGADMVHVPYKSGPQAITDLVTGRIQVAFSVYATTQPFVASGKIRNLAVINDRRFARIPDVPAVRDVVPGFESPPLWGGYFGPAGLPAPIAARLSTEILKALALPEVRTRMEDVGLNVVAGPPAEFAATIKSNVERLAQVMKAARIEPE